MVLLKSFFKYFFYPLIGAIIIDSVLMCIYYSLLSDYSIKYKILQIMFFIFMIPFLIYAGYLNLKSIGYELNDGEVDFWKDIGG